ncbi:MAG: 16S rRNA (uracil(1498)-N(3))-methyltransferase [Verrucomicrobia bacterium]|nr:16S rRNA (uracil(1498)-N(3))-methyltransferase [Verrucomicrobiota bacterium]
MSTHRFFIEPAAWNLQALTLEEPEAHHCLHVLRLGTGSKVVVFNGKGEEANAEITEIEGDRVRLKVLFSGKSNPLRCRTTLAQAIPKGRNMELIVQKATELGVAKIVPLISERTVVEIDSKEGEVKRGKWKQVVIEAAKQCGQNWIPEVSLPISTKAFLRDLDRYDASLIASLQSDSRNFKLVLSDLVSQLGRPLYSVLMLIGPEGDFTPAEISQAKSEGCIPVSLGPIVLRTETAAIYSLSVLAYELQANTIS